jgi:hypothetical protein
MKKKLLEDLKEAMKEKNEIKKNAIQMARAGILQIEKDKGIELTDEQIIELIAKEVKKRKDSISDYEKGGREDLVNQIKEEISYLEVYLPKQLTKEEIQEKLEVIIKNIGATSIKDMGKVMKAAKEEMGASADGKTINEVVKTLLN